MTGLRVRTPSARRPGCIPSATPVRERPEPDSISREYRSKRFRDSPTHDYMISGAREHTLNASSRHHPGLASTETIEEYGEGVGGI